MKTSLILFNVVVFSTLLSSESEQQSSVFKNVIRFLGFAHNSSLAVSLLGRPKNSQNGHNPVKPDRELHRLENPDTVFFQTTPATASVIIKEGITTFGQVNHTTTKGRDSTEYVALEKIQEDINVSSCYETVFGNCFGRRKK